MTDSQESVVAMTLSLTTHFIGETSGKGLETCLLHIAELLVYIIQTKTRSDFGFQDQEQQTKEGNSQGHKTESETRWRSAPVASRSLRT